MLPVISPLAVAHSVEIGDIRLPMPKTLVPDCERSISKTVLSESSICQLPAASGDCTAAVSAEADLPKFDLPIVDLLVVGLDISPVVDDPRDAWRLLYLSIDSSICLMAGSDEE